MLCLVESELIVFGDLICVLCGNNNIIIIDEIWFGLVGYCDLVVEVYVDDGWVGVIGGNVFNLVFEFLILVDE